MLLVQLNVKVRPKTLEKLKIWADELHWDLGEMVDDVVSGYEDFCNGQDDYLDRKEILRLCEDMHSKLMKM